MSSTLLLIVKPGGVNIVTLKFVFAQFWILWWHRIATAEQHCRDAVALRINKGSDTF